MTGAINDPVEEVGSTGEVDGKTNATHVEKDTLFEMLGNERRRHVIDLLREAEATQSLDELATHVAARENGTTVDALEAHERKRVYTSLQQTHLPKMDDADILEFDKDRGTVTASDFLTEYTLHLDVASTTDLTMSGIYLGLSVLGVGIFVLSLLDTPLVGRIPPLWGAATVTVLFGSISVFVRCIRR